MRETILSSPDRTLQLLDAVVADGGRSSVAALARALQIPVASAHRHIATLVRAGYLAPSTYGRHLPGSKLRSLAAKIDDRQILANAAVPVLERLAARTEHIVQLGIFENDMVTYLVKAGQSADALFTKVGMQLEAYCSGIGKVLLAHLSASAQADYLAGGPFVALTPHTITNPADMRAELERVADQDFAEDLQEVALGLQCIAVPVRSQCGSVVAAISASCAAADVEHGAKSRNLRLLREAAVKIGQMI
jgi:IclR family transcriptional regulator, acetate operon repressor